MVNPPAVPGMTRETPGLPAGAPGSALPFDTTEVRWFGEGSMPAEVVDWFTESGAHGYLEIRQDAYLPATSPSVGRKRRNFGPFEVKTRSGTGTTFQLTEGLLGRIEEWRKIVSTMTHHRLPTMRWWRVHKVVITRTFHHLGSGETHEVPYGDTSVPGCDIELAEVTIDDVEAWTFAFEAWGILEQRRILLEAAAMALLASTGVPCPTLYTLDASMGYPEWLAYNDSRIRHQSNPVPHR